MKLLELLRRKSPAEHVVVRAAGEIVVRDPQIFGAGLPGAYFRFCDRVLPLDGICSVTVDRRAASATIRYSPGDDSPAVILQRIAAALMSDAVQLADDTLREVLQGVDGRVFTVFRHGDSYSTSPTRYSRPYRPARGIRRFVYLGLAGGSFVMSIVGVLLPGIPAVPFVLLTSYYLACSYPPLNERLLRSRLFGPMIRDWQEHGGMRPKVKGVTLLIMLTMATLTVLLAELSGLMLVVVAILICVGVYSILRLPTVPDVESPSMSHGRTVSIQQA